MLDLNGLMYIKTSINNLVWNLLSPHVHTIDSNMQKIQEAVIKSAILITKLLSNNASQLDKSQIESAAGTDSLGLLGQGNKLITVRRKDLHKSNLNPEYLHETQGNSIHAHNSSHMEMI